jgi:MFS transporter, ACDE family, multidrug resistance protein
MNDRHETIVRCDQTRDAELAGGTARPRLWYALILGFVGFVTSFGAHIVAVNLPTYAEQVGVGVAVIGLLIAVYDLAEIIAKPLFGALADRRGMKQTLLAGIALFVVASLVYAVIDPRLLIVVRFGQGIGAAALSAVSLALIGIYYQEQRGRGYGIYNAIKGAGYVLSPIIGTALVWRSQFASIFLASAAVGGLAFVLTLLLPEPQTRGESAFDDDDDFALSGLATALRQATLWPWYAVTVINMFFVGILFGFLPVRVHALDYGPVPTGVLLTLAAASYLLIQPLAGVAADRYGADATVRLGLGLAGLSVIAIPFAAGVPLGLVAVLAGIGVGTVWTNTDALVSTLAQRGQMGATMGVAGSFKELGDMLGPLLIGLLAQIFGLTTGFVVCGVLGLLVLVAITRHPPARVAATAAGLPADQG